MLLLLLLLSLSLNYVRLRQRTCFFFFHAPKKSFNKPFEFLLYKTNRLDFSVCVYCNRSQKTSQRVKNNSHATRLRLVSYRMFFTRCDEVIYDILQYTPSTFPCQFSMSNSRNFQYPFPANIHGFFIHARACSQNFRVFLQVQ